MSLGDHSSLALVLLIAGGAGLLAVLRRLSRPVDASSLEAPKTPTVLGSVPASQTDNEPQLRIRKQYFRTFDFETGPPDSQCFYDELFVELENPSSGDTWTQSLFVATPSGIEQVMREEGWDYMYGIDLLIVRTYDRELILTSLLDHLEERYEIAPELPRDPHLG